LENQFKWKHFESQIILLCVRWYLKYHLSYRNLVEMMEERGLSVSHTTILRGLVASNFLLQNAFLDRLSSLLCDAVTGEKDGKGM
jgi:transposase-like protein